MQAVRKLGLIGGMSWVSTRMYYEDINRMVQRQRGDLASAPLLIESLDFTELYGLAQQGDWDRATTELSESAKRLEQAGAGALLIAANSMHRVYDEVASAVDVPIFHIADCVGAKMAEAKAEKAALLGTRNVMTEGFYRERLIEHGVQLLPPDPEVVEELDRIIYDELMLGRVRRDAERKLKTIITNKEKDGADAIVLACTELELIVDVDANVLPIFDGAHIHAEQGVNWLLGAD